MRGKLAGMMGMCLAFCPAIHGQTVDIADFFILEEDYKHTMDGWGDWDDWWRTIGWDVKVKKAFGYDNQGIRQLSIYMLRYSVSWSFDLEVTPSHLLLHKSVYRDLDFSMETREFPYPDPIPFLPRLVTIGHEYSIEAGTELPVFYKTIRIDGIEEKSYGSWTVPTLRLVLTDELDTLTLWLARDIGIVELYFDWKNEVPPGTAGAYLTGPGGEWTAQLVDCQWGNTLREGTGGWRTHHWMGLIFPLAMNSPWAFQGMGWTYCTGTDDNEWLYLPGHGWLWTNATYYPLMYRLQDGHWMSYRIPSGFPTRDQWFYDWNMQEWVNLGNPG
ncbi:hypothetical protein G0Q06_05200 [Puniceicoccales bacterium CK1056]|uniref:Uncharacterized protein n=1 Tax=Oceanipulchritudo coccoides TaxID=2706888 RepID=A0A6B2LYS4_9BACT|nr:hypothetical protein [Oceanipulchritudo coccoides]NDV61841.1 hypothetical protein [Oceanipulchritudo coccoides]